MENNFFIEYDFSSAKKVQRICGRRRRFLSSLVPFIALGLLANGAVVSEKKTESKSGLAANFEQRNAGREPRILADFLHRQGCCEINVPKTNSMVTSPLNEYAFMVKSIFEKFSAKSAAESLNEYKKSMKQHNEEVNGNTVKQIERKLDKEDDSASSEHSEEDMREEKDEDLSFEDKRNSELARLKDEIIPSKLSRAGDNSRKMRTTRGVEKRTRQFSRETNKFRRFKYEEDKLGRQNGYEDDSEEDFNPVEVVTKLINSLGSSNGENDGQNILNTILSYIPKPSNTETLNQNAYLQNSNQGNEAQTILNALLAYIPKPPNSGTLNQNPAAAVATKLIKKGIGNRENEAQRIYNALLAYSALPDPYNTDYYNTGSLSTSGLPNSIMGNLKGEDADIIDSDDEVKGVRTKDKKGKKGKGGNTENVGNPHVFHNENNVNIFSIHGYPKNVKKKKAEEESEESEEDDHGWGWGERKSAKHNRGRRRPQGRPSKHNRGRRREKRKPIIIAKHNNNRQWGWKGRKPEVHDHGWGWESPEDTNESESEERKIEDENSTEMRNKSLLQPPGMNVALSMSPVFTVTNSHGSSGVMYPTLPKAPGLLPALPDAGGILPELPGTRSNSTNNEDNFNTDTEEEGEADNSEDAEAEPTIMQDYEEEE